MSMRYKSDNPAVNPNHYKRNGMETIDVIEAFTSDLCGIEATDTGNILKYACRWKEKGGKQDVEKIIWYATHLLNHLNGTEDEGDIKVMTLVSERGA